MTFNQIGEKCFFEHQKALDGTKTLLPVITKMAGICAGALRDGHKVMVCGNGGSAADAQHIAAEFMGRYYNERRALPSIALTTDTSILTAIANDYAYDCVFSRQVEGIGQKGDVFWGISTGGKSSSVNQAALKAKELGLITLASTGKDGGNLAKICECSLIIPSNITARIQEMHMLCAHMICQMIDEMNWDNL